MTGAVHDLVLHDLAVVGGGPVGLAAALHAAAAGLDVVVLEPRGGEAIDKACGEGLMPGALEAVLALGVDPPGAPITGITYVGAEGRRVGHDFRAGPGRGVRRTVLHAALAERVRAAGVPVVAARVLDLTQDGARARLATSEGTVTARWVLGCDGLHSAVRRAAGLDEEPAQPSRVLRYGVRRHAAIAPWTSHVEVHWGHGVEGYVTPVGPSEVGIAVLGPRGTGFAEALAQLPELADRLAGAAWTTSARGAGPLRQRARSVASGRVLLAGDAAGYVDALTGEGLRVGLAAAQAAVAAVASGVGGLRTPGSWARGPERVGEQYARAWRSQTRPYRVLTSALLAATRPSAARAALVPVAAAAPGLFGTVVERLAR